MKKADSFSWDRRTFITSISGVFFGHVLFGLSQNSSINVSIDQKAKEELSTEELEWIEGSVLAKDLKKYLGQGYSCAESILMVSLRYLEKQEELVWAATGFGGGMYQRDLCGFLTGGIMALGFACGMLGRPREEAKEFCGRLVTEYWKWWGSMAPHRCAQIRTEGISLQVCVNHGLLSAAKLEELIEPIK